MKPKVHYCYDSTDQELLYCDPEEVQAALDESRLSPVDLATFDECADALHAVLRHHRPYGDGEWGPTAEHSARVHARAEAAYRIARYALQRLDPKPAP